MSDPKQAREPTYAEGSEPFLRAMGMVATLWAHLEHDISESIWEFANVSRQAGACMTAQIVGPGPRIRCLASLMKLRKSPDSIIKEFNSLASEIEAAGRMRNRYLHDQLFIEDESRPWGLGDGTRLRRDRSMLADAQRRYNAAADDDEALKDTPLPNPPPQEPATGRAAPAARPGGGREQAVLAAKSEFNIESNLSPLSLHARALYEARVVPVREVARLCGVSVAGLYYHVRRQGWLRRRALVPRDKAKSERQRLRYQALKAARPPAQRGLKARDPDGQARALAKVDRAAALAGAALSRALARQDAESRARTLTMLGRALRDVAIANGVVKASALRKKPAKSRAQCKEWRAIGETPLWADKRRVR